MNSALQLLMGPPAQISSHASTPDGGLMDPHHLLTLMGEVILAATPLLLIVD